MKKAFLVTIALLSIFTINNCKNDTVDPDIPTPEVPAVYDDTPYDLDYTGFREPILDGEPITNERVRLGRMLFYENLLSKDNSISCASCHVQANAFSDTNKFSAGVDGSLGHRQSMSAFNLLWHSQGFFWDGRASLLREQALMPIQDPLEMKESLENVILKLEMEKAYTNQFIRAYGDDTISEERIALALEQFMQTIISNRSKYDKVEAGQLSYTESEARGKVLYFAEYNPGFPDQSGADCQHCHGGDNFDNTQFFNNGIDTESDQDDYGLELVTGNPAHRAKFKVPSLRNIELTPPYMHDGRFATLEEVVDHYDHGIKDSPTLDPALAYSAQTGLQLTEQDKKDLIAFLKTLTDTELINDERYSNPFITE